MANLSNPGCWAYPDMIEVGKFRFATASMYGCGRMSACSIHFYVNAHVHTPLQVGVINMQNLGVPPLNESESRTHFAAWAIVSAPLILGFDVTNATTLDAVWPIVSNAEVLAINADYAGESGSRYYASDDVTMFTPCGWWAHNCSFPTIQYWSKLLSNGDVAVLLMNNGVSARPLTLEFHAVPGLVMRQGSQAALRDVWAHADLGTFDGAYVTPTWLLETRSFSA